MANKLIFPGLAIGFVALVMHLAGIGGPLVTILCAISTIMVFPYDKLTDIYSVLFEEDDRLRNCVGRTEMRHHSSSSLESFAMEKTFKPRPSDIIISTPPKTGTTLMQQMCHQIRTGGDMDFEDIYYVVPWTCHFGDLKQDPNADQRAEPRCFKSHQAPSALYGAKCKYIYTIRNPEKAYVSFYSFLKTLGVLPEEMDIDTFVQKIVVKGTDYPPLFDFYVEYWKCAHLTDMVLLLKFEDIIAKKERTIREVANFMGVKCDDALIKKVDQLTSIEVMNDPAHSSKFDGSVTNDIIAKNATNAQHLKIAKRATDGSHHKKYKLSKETLKLIESEWKKKVFAATGCKDYEDYSAKLIAKSRA